MSNDSKKISNTQIDTSWNTPIRNNSRIIIITIVVLAALTLIALSAVSYSTDVFHMSGKCYLLIPGSIVGSGILATVAFLYPWIQKPNVTDRQLNQEVIATKTPPNQRCNKQLIKLPSVKLDPTILDQPSFNNGGFTLKFYPYTVTKNVDGIALLFKLNPLTGAVTLTIPQTEKQICLYIKEELEMYSTCTRSLEQTFIPRSQNTKVQVFELIDGSWQPTLHFDFSTDKLKALPEILDPQRRGKKINGLAIKKSPTKAVIIAAQEWIGKGNYVEESDTIEIRRQDGQRYIQDLKVAAFVAAGVTNQKVLNEQPTSLDRLSQKKANINCWQFCLLAYIEAGFLSWEIIGNLYIAMDKLSKTQKLRIPDAIKYGKASPIDFRHQNMTPTAGDILCFSRQVNIDWHCAIFQISDPQTGEYSYIEILDKHVRISKDKECNGVTFVRKEDVESNLLNFLATHHQYLIS